MSKRAGTKAARFELECLAFLRDHGIDGELRYGQSATELSDTGRHGDIESTAGNWECKRRAGLPAWGRRPTENVRGTFCRRGPRRSCSCQSSGRQDFFKREG